MAITVSSHPENETAGLCRKEEFRHGQNKAASVPEQEQTVRFCSSIFLARSQIDGININIGNG
ncbi:hypothetical protein MASR1M12_10380 [Erysipelotrichia bacterium]